jgi:hypothetical protein
VQSLESQETLRRNISPPSSGSKKKLSKEPLIKEAANRLHGVILQETELFVSTGVSFQVVGQWLQLLCWNMDGDAL